MDQLPYTRESGMVFSKDHSLVNELFKEEFSASMFLFSVITGKSYLFTQGSRGEKSSS